MTLHCHRFHKLLLFFRKKKNYEEERKLLLLLVMKLSTRRKKIIGSFSKFHLLTFNLMSRHFCNFQQNTGGEQRRQEGNIRT
jgi:hypothetical protein